MSLLTRGFKNKKRINVIPGTGYNQYYQLPLKINREISGVGDNCIKVSFQRMNNGSHVLELAKNGQYTIQSGDLFTYSIFWSSPNDNIVVDYICSDGSSLLFTTNAFDTLGYHASAVTNISTLCLNKWYDRVVPFPSSHVGKTIVKFIIISYGSGNNTLNSSFIKNILIKNSSYTTQKEVILSEVWDNSQNLSRCADICKYPEQQNLFGNIVNVKESQILSNWKDLRFTLKNGSADLPYWIECYDPTSAVVWVKLPITCDCIEMVYNNPAAQSYSSITSTMESGLQYGYHNGITPTIENWLGSDITKTIWKDWGATEVKKFNNNSWETLIENLSMTFYGWLVPPTGYSNTDIYITIDDGANFYLEYAYNTFSFILDSTGSTIIYNSTPTMNYWSPGNLGLHKWTCLYPFVNITPIKLEWWNGPVQATLKLGWDPGQLTQSPTMIPSSNLYCRSWSYFPPKFNGSVDLFSSNKILIF